MAITRYTKTGAGSLSGSAWSNAKKLESLNADIQAARPDDTFLVGFDRDRETPVYWSRTAISLGRSGSRSAPIRIAMGFIGHNDDVQPIGARGGAIFLQNATASLARKVGQVPGGEPYLRVAGGVEAVELAGWSFRGAPRDGFLRFDRPAAGGTCSQVLLRDIHGQNVGRVIETQSGVRLRDVTIENCSATGIARGFARFRSIEDARLRNLLLDAAAMDGAGEDVCQLLAFDSATGIILENIVMRNAVNMVATGEGRRRSDYVQGDGIVCEKETSNFVIRNCHAADLGDGGFDLKTKNLLIEDCSAIRCKFGARIWSPGNNLMRRSAMLDPRSYGGAQGACVWAAGQIDLVDCQLQAGAGTTAFRFGTGGEAAPRIRMHGGRIQLDAGAALVAGTGGVLELDQVSVNGEIRSGSFDK